TAMSSDLDPMSSVEGVSVFGSLWSKAPESPRLGSSASTFSCSVADSAGAGDGGTTCAYGHNVHLRYQRVDGRRSRRSVGRDSGSYVPDRPETPGRAVRALRGSGCRRVNLRRRRIRRPAVAP